MNAKTTGYGRQFRWSKVVGEGAITYRLFSRRHDGLWQPKKLIFTSTMPRAEIAHLLRQAHHELRELVDVAQLKEWGYL